MSRTLLGISYVLVAIPLINLVGIALLPIAWLIEGKRRGKGLWIATGVIGLIAIILGVAGLAVLSHAVSTAISGFSEEFLKTSVNATSSRNALITELSKAISASALGITGEAMLVVSTTILLIFFLIMLASLYQAGKVYNSLLIKTGFVMYLIWIFLTIPIAALLAASVISPQAAATSLVTANVAKWLVINLVAFFIASILTGIGFLNARESPILSQR